jgi:hypothetical protein
MVRAVVAGVGIVLVGVSAAHAVDTSMTEVLPYATARRVLLLRGFHPFVMPGASTCGEGDPRCYPELVACTHKRHWICDYTWRAGRSIYQAETNAEVPVVDSFYCLVNCGAPALPAAADRH